MEEKLRAHRPAQSDRLLRPLRVGSPKKGLSATLPGTRLRPQVPTLGGPPDTPQLGHGAVDTVAHYDNTTTANYVNSLTFVELSNG